MIITQDYYEQLRDRYRSYMLDASDKAMNEIAATCSVLTFRDNCSGARDADLPKFFKALDAQFVKNLAHGGSIVED